MKRFTFHCIVKHKLTGWGLGTRFALFYFKLDFRLLKKVDRFEEYHIVIFLLSVIRKEYTYTYIYGYFFKKKEEDIRLSKLHNLLMPIREIFNPSD